MLAGLSQRRTHLKPLVLCVPNFSEGRRPDIMEAIIHAMLRAGGVYLLDHSADADHNRMVVSLAGIPEEVNKAVLAGIEYAAEHIDLNQHRGVHPRFGATDVVPLIPLRDIDLATCAEYARKLGAAVAQSLRLPVYYYGEAATRRAYRELNQIRTPSFQYEQLREVIAIDPAWVPDSGPAEIGPAGAVLIGARPPLIAYNAYLNTDDVTVAKRVARAIRASNGGLSAVRASGFLVDGRAQVSMNLVDYRQTPLHQALELLRREAARYGASVTGTELIGLLPQDALMDSAAWYWQLDDFSPNRVLEWRLAQAQAERDAIGQEEPPIPSDATSQIILPERDEMRYPETFATAVASAQATPGGGSVTAQVGGLAAALAEMVAGLTIGRRQYGEVEERMIAIRTAADSLRHQLTDTIAQDIDAVEHLLAILRRANQADDPDTMAEDIQSAMLNTADIPLKVMRLVYDVLQLMAPLAELGNHNAAIDAAVGAQMAQAAIEGAALNIQANLMGVTDRTIRQRYIDESRGILEESRRLGPTIIQTASDRVGLNEDEAF